VGSGALVDATYFRSVLSKGLSSYLFLLHVDSDLAFDLSSSMSLVTASPFSRPSGPQACGRLENGLVIFTFFEYQTVSTPSSIRRQFKYTLRH